MSQPHLYLKSLILEAGSRMKKQFGKVKTIQIKEGATTNLVTNVDKDIEDFIKNRIRKKFPQDSILAEESDAEQHQSQRKWIIDPLDGTTNFAHSLPIFCISIAIEETGVVTAGAVYNPIANEFFFTRRGKGAFLNGKKVEVSKVKKLNKALLVTGFPYTVHTNPEHSLPYFNELIVHAQGIRRLGSAALDLCYVAMGRFDGFFEVYLNPWDTAAGMLMLLEAGGMITDFSGKPYSIYQRQLAASNGFIQDEMLAVIKETKLQALREVAK
ncbi:MAG TPA: inositol monophosphatase family protein [Acidobacteriota bacterium]|nr:inositol monophosphatase family protein [Acidobacteriota bacterium]